jgi:hypothetical protein
MADPKTAQDAIGWRVSVYWQVFDPFSGFSTGFRCVSWDRLWVDGRFPNEISVCRSRADEKRWFEGIVTRALSNFKFAVDYGTVNIVCFYGTGPRSWRLLRGITLKIR